MNEIESIYRELTGAARALAQGGSLESLLKAARLSAPDGLLAGSGGLTNGLASLVNFSQQPTSATNGIAAAASNIKSAAQAVAGAAARNLASGFMLGPIFTLFAGLFGGDKQESEETELAKYVPPESIHFTGAMPTHAGLPVLGVDYDQSGLPRLMATALLAPFINKALNGPTAEYGAQATQGLTYAPTITVQVQALDSRSFLEHSDEIARAVREALLNSHSLGDVLGEL